MPSENNNLFQQFGLPNETASDYRRRKQKAAYDARRAEYQPNMKTSAGILGNFGHQIGSLISSRGEKMRLPI